MRAYTSLEQSKKLAEFLPLESADMCYVIDYAESNRYGTDHYNIEVDNDGLKVQRRDNIPCWSLAALLSIMPPTALDSSDDHYFRLHCKMKFSEWHNNPIDAAFEMILKLKML